MKSFWPTAVVAALMSVVSCSPKEENVFVPSTYVKNLVSDKFSSGSMVLSAYTSPARSGDIVLAGSIDRCQSFTQMLLSSDCHDNVTGRHVRDGLQDFCGEKIVSLFSETDGSDADLMITADVSQLVCAMDSSYHLSPYDVEGLGHKSRAKLLVFANPSTYVLCKSDIDFLTGYFGSSVPIVFPIEETVRRCLAAVSSDVVTVGFISDSVSFCQTAYDHALSEVTSECGRTVGSSFSWILPDGCDDPLISFMDAYVAAGHTVPLDAVIVDTYVPDMSDYDTERMAMGSVLSPESLVYGKYLSDDFTVIGVYDTTADLCYHIMRDRNLFTHNISLPYSESFRMSHHPDTSNHSFISVPYVI